MLQIAELDFYDASGNSVPIASASGGATPPYPQQGPGSLLDDNVASKWVDVGFGTTPSELTVHVPPF